MINQIKVYLGVISAVVLWGTSWLATKTVLTELSAYNTAVLRVLVAGMIYFILLKLLYPNQTLKREDWLYTWGIGAFCIGGYFLIQCAGLSRTTTVNSSIILGSSPILTTLISAKVFGHERLTLPKLLGALVGFTGIFLVFSGGKGLSLGGATLKGDLIMLGSALTWAFFGVLSKRLVDKYDPFVAIAYGYIFGAITLLPLVFIDSFLPSVKGMSLKGWVALIYLAGFCSVFAFYAWYQGIKVLGASRTAVFNYLNPLVAVTIGFLFLREPVNFYTLLGGIAIFAGVFVASLGKGKTSKKAQGL